MFERFIFLSSTDVTILMKSFVPVFTFYDCSNNIKQLFQCRDIQLYTIVKSIRGVVLVLSNSHAAHSHSPLGMSVILTQSLNNIHIFCFCARDGFVIGTLTVSGRFQVE